MEMNTPSKDLPLPELRAARSATGVRRVPSGFNGGYCGLIGGFCGLYLTGCPENFSNRGKGKLAQILPQFRAVVLI